MMHGHVDSVSCAPRHLSMDFLQSAKEDMYIQLWMYIVVVHRR